MSVIVLYFLHSTSVLSFYIDVVLTLSIQIGRKDTLLKISLVTLDTQIADPEIALQSEMRGALKVYGAQT